MTLILKSDQDYTGVALGDINGVLGATDWQSMLNFSDNRYISKKSEQRLADVVNFTRDGAAWYFDDNDYIFEIPTNTPRVTKNGLRIESARNNVFLNSNTPVSQEIDVAADAWYAYRIKGNGTINITQTGATSTGAVSNGSIGFIKTGSAVKAQVSISGQNTYAQVSRIYSTNAPSIYDNPIPTVSAAVGVSAPKIKIANNLIAGLGGSFTVVIHVDLNYYTLATGLAPIQPIMQIDFSSGAHIAIASVLSDSNPTSTPSIGARIFYGGVEKNVISGNDRSRSLTLAISVTPTSVTFAKNGTIVGSSAFESSVVNNIDIGTAEKWVGLAPSLDGNATHVAIYDYGMNINELAPLSSSWV